jgi:hypothetical protein
MLSVQRLAFIIERTMIIAKMFLMEGNLECREANALWWHFGSESTSYATTVLAALLLLPYDKIIIYMQVIFKRSAKLSLVFTACSDQQMHQ